MDEEEIPGSEDFQEWWEPEVKDGFYFLEGVAHCYVNGKEVYPVNGYYHIAAERDVERTPDPQQDPPTDSP